MLGVVECAQRWLWTAHGKHPAAKDYLSVGQRAPLSQAFADWMDRGYGTLISRKLTSPILCSYRFWARGGAKDGLICGLLKHSADSVGRPYPLLVIGTGPLMEWEDQWDLVPFACERSWNHMERISTKTFEDLNEFDAEIHKIAPPSPQWSEFKWEREDLGKERAISSVDMSAWKGFKVGKQKTRLSVQSEIFVPMDEGSSLDQFTLVSLWHSSIKSAIKSAPNAVFMGGTPTSSFLAVYQRPLLESDFVRLWSVCSENESRK